MKLKRLLILGLFLLISLSMSGCETWFNLNLFETETTTVQTTTMLELVNGTISFDSTEYVRFSTYVSDTYQITNVDAYNDVLLATQEHVRRANIEIETRLYEERKNIALE